MNKMVYKYQLNTTNNQSVWLPKGAEILTVQTQNNIPYIWVLIDTSQPMEERRFEIFGTGASIHYDMGTDRKYIRTYQLYSKNLVFHLFEYTGV
jgi:hypothetical protein